MKQKAHTLASLKAAMVQDLATCHTKLERQMVKVICEKEMRELAQHDGRSG